jgi:hypothetical protein
MILNFISKNLVRQHRILVNRNLREGAMRVIVFFVFDSEEKQWYIVCHAILKNAPLQIKVYDSRRLRRIPPELLADQRMLCNAFGFRSSPVGFPSISNYLLTYYNIFVCRLFLVLSIQDYRMPVTTLPQDSG